MCPHPRQLTLDQVKLIKNKGDVAMKPVLQCCLSAIISCCLYSTSVAQTVPNLPVGLAGSTAEVWNNEIYLFGGATGYFGTVDNSMNIYKYDGVNWTVHDQAADSSLWGSASVLVGDVVYLIGGFPFTNTTTPSKIRKYDLNTGDWTYLQNYEDLDVLGITAEYYDGKIYVFNSTNTDDVFAYDIATNTWSAKTPAPTSTAPGMNSVLYNDEIYLTGFTNEVFYKYNPASDQWTELAAPPRHLKKCGMGLIFNLIYCAGGGMNDGSVPNYDDVVVYNISTNSWSTYSYILSVNKHWMASAEFNGGFSVFGGRLAVGNQVTDEVEEIVPQGTVPVELTSFTANVINGNVILNWSTATELNNHRFEIERRKSGEYHTIGFVNGNGTTTEPKEYSFADQFADVGINFYRLKQIDFRGTFEYSEAIEVNVPLKSYALEQNYPNPFNPSTQINFSIPDKSFVTLKVYNMQGEEVATLIQEELLAGIFSVEWNAENVPSGVYVYSMIANNKVQSHKMILLR